MVAQIAEQHEAEVVDFRPAPAPELDDALDALAAAADNLAAAVDKLRGDGRQLAPELLMLTERAVKAARAGQLYRSKHYPKGGRLR